MKLCFENISKSYGRPGQQILAVDSISWEASGGEVFGILGPNGAGKSTMIRILLDIIRPDSGRITIDSLPYIDDMPAFWRRVGYLPEERGLYRQEKVFNMLVHLGRLKGMSKKEAAAKSSDLLEQFDLKDWANKKIDNLSKGMGQKLQFASCIMHDPEIVILDEPFFGLDPINVKLLRSMINQLKKNGKLVLLSTHMMGEVETLCDRILMINHGRQVLYGDLAEIKKAYSSCDVVVDLTTDTSGIDIIENEEVGLQLKRITLKSGYQISDLMRALGERKRNVKRLEEASRPIEDIFISLVQEQERKHA